MKSFHEMNLGFFSGLFFSVGFFRVFFSFAFFFFLSVTIDGVYLKVVLSHHELNSLMMIHGNCG